MRQTASRGCPQVTAAYRAEQLERWEKSETNSQPAEPKRPSKIRFNIGTVFLAACDQFDRECVIELLEQGADINTVNIDGLTALHQVSTILLLTNIKLTLKYALHVEHLKSKFKIFVLTVKKVSSIMSLNILYQVVCNLHIISASFLFTILLNGFEYSSAAFSIKHLQHLS